MQIKLNINGVDFTPWISEGGLVQTPIYRQGRSVTVLSGKLFQSRVEKRGISVSLVEIRDNTLENLMDAITPLSEVEYTDRKYGNRKAKFYVSVTSTPAKKVVGGNTYYQGVTLELEEM